MKSWLLQPWRTHHWCINGMQCWLQDIAVVPFLILLPIIETTDLEGQSTATLLTLFVPTALQTLGSLALLLLGGRLILRRVFELVAESRSDETFVALCLLTVTGASLLTQRLGFSDTLGAFIAGVLLAETNYRTQVGPLSASRQHMQQARKQALHACAFSTKPDAC